MTLPEKILALRKQRGLSQEELAGRLQVSRQAVSRWEVGSAQPDAHNILQLSRLFGVTADYLLDDACGDPPRAQAEVRRGSGSQVLAALLTLEVMVLLLQGLCAFVLQSVFFTALCALPFAALAGGFEYAFRKQSGRPTGQAAALRKTFYKATAWLGLYFPVRLAVGAAMTLYPRPCPALAPEVVTVILYAAAALLAGRAADKALSGGK